MSRNKGRAPSATSTDNIATTITVTEDLKEVIREGRELMKDMNAAEKRLRDLIASIPKITEEAIGDKVKREMATLEKVTLQAMDDSVERVSAKFDEFSALLMGETRKQRRTGEMGLHELLERLMGLPPGVTVEVTAEGVVRSDSMPTPYDPTRRLAD